MDEENRSYTDPDEAMPDIDTEAIDEDWNSAPDDKLGEYQDDDQYSGELEDQDETVGSDAADENVRGGDDPVPGSGSDQSFSLRHLGENRTVGRDEVITLAQKGLDYDRIRGKYDETNAELRRTEDAYALLKELAAPQGITAEQLIDETRAQMLVQKHGIEPSAAAQRVMSSRAAKDKLNPRAGSPEFEAAAKRQTEIREFLAEYGTGVDPKSIPREVWESVGSGRTLLSAYQAWELKKLRLESKAAKKNAENKTRSAGSRFSAGSVRGRDAIVDDWYDN